MLPNFLITGVQKAATSWLAVCLGEHPQIFIPDTKEIFFFDKHYSRGLGWYEAQFSGWSGERAVGEATPNYLFEQKVPERISDNLGSIKLITSLRHPVDRAYSAFWHYVRRGLISPNADFKTEFEQDGAFALRTRGNYLEQINRFSNYFPQESHLIVIQEEIKTQPSKILQQCFTHLEVSVNYKPSRMSDLVNTGDRILLFHKYIYKIRKLLDKLPENTRNKLVMHATRAQGHIPESRKTPQLDPNLRSELFEKYYSSDVKKLSQIIAKDFTFWL